jgi:hypothetical protein
LTTSSSSSFSFIELLPGPLFFYCSSLSTFTLFYRLFLGTYFHYSGTNRMVSRQQQEERQQEGHERKEDVDLMVGVVDEELKVHRVQKLRVADASVFPHIPSAPIAAIVMAVGLAAGEMISRDALAPSSDSVDLNSL